MLPRCLLALVLCLHAGVFSLQAQDSLLYKRLSIPESRSSVEQAMKIIEQQTGLSFSFNSGLINKRAIVILKADEERLIDILHRVFNDPTLTFDVIGRHLVIYRPFKTESAHPEKTDSVYYFTISGKVFDRDTRTPVAFSSIFLVGKPIGTISNAEGEFELRLKSTELQETLGISSIGYKNFTAPVTSLVNINQNFFLEPDIIPIQEVIIRKISPLMLLKNANNRIFINYPDKPSLLTSFYRETVRRGNHYTMVSEAILENFKAGYDTYTPDRVKILKGRKNENFTRDDSVMLKLKAGLNTMLLLDVVKNMPDFLTGESIQDYHYRLADLVVEDGRDHYVVEFTPRKDSPEGVFYSGRIIIDINDMAFKWVEFQVDPDKLDLATDNFILRKPPNMVVKALKASYKVSFRKLGSKYYLHMIQCETAFKIRNRRQLTGSIYNTKLETVVIDIDTVDVNRFPQRESARQHEFFTDQVGEYDESFWGEYSFITPDESLENAITRLGKALRQAAAE